MNAQHTPPPWEVNGSLIVKDCYGKVIADTDVSLVHPPKRYVSHAERKANAVHIVRCVNNHDELVKGLRSALRYIPANGTAERDLREAIDDVLTKIERG